VGGERSSKNGVKQGDSRIPESKIYGKYKYHDGPEITLEFALPLPPYHPIHRFLPQSFNMRANPFTIFSLLGAFASAIVIPDAAPEALVVREDTKAAEGDFAMASCSCKKVSNPGLYCGFCTVKAGTGVGPGNAFVNTVYVDNVAWCNTAGGCEDYGYSSHCHNRETRGCKGIDAW
jgi:hypothetical protein